jgi:hypothetical protein
MSEEFYLSASFTMPGTDQMEALEELIENIYVCDYDAAREILDQHQPQQARQMIRQITVPGSYYDDEFDLITSLSVSYDDCVDDMELKISDSGLTAIIEVEGQDHDAIDFCAALVLMLVAMEAAIQVKAGSAMWNASWTSDTDGVVQLNLETEE